jgi:hypothetical protein
METRKGERECRSASGIDSHHFTRNGVEDTSLSSSEQGKAFNSKPGHDLVRMIVGGRNF